mgnify:CR=1 FL=1
MATVNIGSLKFNWKGNYNGSTAYAIDDVTEYNGSSYICILASTGNLPTNTTYFQPMATKGTDGTDVGTTLTTQGDILYRDGSGLQRLPKGTAGQVLQMNSGATAPEYGTVSSDYVKLVSGTHSGTELNLDNIFTTSYPLYKVFMYDVITPNSWLGMRTRTGGASGTTYSGSEYRYISKMFYKPSGGNSDTSESGWGDSKFRIAWTNQSNSEKPQYFELTIPEPWSTATKFTYGFANTFNNDTYIGHATGAGQIDQTASTVYTGLNFYQDGGNSWTGKYSVYGLKI